jgi:RNA polymerase sigma-54 factor
MPPFAGDVMSAIQRLELRQGQSLTMTPQLVQSIKLLQLSHAELAAYVEAELERNPLLQEGETQADAPVPSLADFLRAKQKAEAAGPRIVPGPSPSRVAAAGSSSSGSVPGQGELDASMEATLTRAASLAEHLEAQLEIVAVDARLRAIGRHLIHTLD